MSTCTAWHLGSGPHPEDEKASLVWKGGTLQPCSQDSLWHTGWWRGWGGAGPGRSKMPWKQLNERDCREWKLSAIYPSSETHLEIWCEICQACSKPTTKKGAYRCGCCPKNINIFWLKKSALSGAMIISQSNQSCVILCYLMWDTVHINLIKWQCRLSSMWISNTLWSITSNFCFTAEISVDVKIFMTGR